MNLRNLERPIERGCVYSNVINDFTAAYQSAKVIRCSGNSFVPTANQIAKIIRYAVDAGKSTPYLVDIVNITVTSGVGYFDITFVPDLFSATDLFEVYLLGAEKAYNSTDDAIKVKVANICGATADVLPLIPVVNASNLNSTSYWPSANGMKMEIGNKHLSMWDFSYNGVTTTLEVSPTPAFTTPIPVAGVNITDGTTVASSWTDSNGKRIDYAELGMCYYRVKVVADATSVSLVYVNQF
jgi:hypothetical protein